MCVCMYVCMYVCAYVCMYVHMYICPNSHLLYCIFYILHFICLICSHYNYVVGDVCDCSQSLLHYRCKKTVAESQTLEAVRKELEKIDTILSYDVLILRDKIEEVNRKFESSRLDCTHSTHTQLSCCLHVAWHPLLCTFYISLYVLVYIVFLFLIHTFILCKLRVCICVLNCICTESGLNMLKRSMLLPSWNSIKQLKQRNS